MPHARPERWEFQSSHSLARLPTAWTGEERAPRAPWGSHQKPDGHSRAIPDGKGGRAGFPLPEEVGTPTLIHTQHHCSQRWPPRR